MKRYIRRPLIISFLAALLLAIFVWAGFYLSEFYRSPAYFWVLAVTGGSVVGGFIFVFVYWFFYRPISQLDRQVHKIMKADYVPRLRTNRRDILDRVRRRLNDVFKEITELKVQVIEEEHLRYLDRWEDGLRETLAGKEALAERTSRELSDRLRELSLLNEISRTVNSSLSLDEVLQLLTNIVGKTLGYREFVILLKDEEESSLTAKASYGTTSSRHIAGMRFAPGEGVSGIVAQSGKRILIRDTSRDPRYLHYKGKKPEDGSFLSIPVKSRGKTLGVFNFFRPTVDGFSVQEMRLLSTIANQAAGAIEKARLFEKVQKLSQTDDLTRLCNRRHTLDLLEQEVKRARRFNQNLALLLVDAEFLKNYRSRFGLLAADEILVDLAGILISSIHDTDTVGRYGEDSFLVILPRTEKKNAEEIAKTIRDRIHQYRFPRQDSQPEEPIALAIGLSVYPEDGTDRTALLFAADRSLRPGRGENPSAIEDQPDPGPE